MRLIFCFVVLHVTTSGLHFSVEVSDELFLLDNFERLQILFAKLEKTEYFVLPLICQEIA